MVEYDMEYAVQKAEEFLEERHSTTNLESSSLQDGTWCLVFDVGFLQQQLKEIKISASSGKIIGYTRMDADDGDEDDD